MPDDDELDELEVAALAVAPDEEDEEAETPGIVSALTVPKMPTPATAAKAMPAVIWFSRVSARSRAWILASAAFVFSICRKSALSHSILSVSNLGRS